MLTVKHVTSEGEIVWAVSEVRFDKDSGTVFVHHFMSPELGFRYDMPLTGGTVYVMNDRGSTVAKHVLGPAR